jgi:hypothetical protein
MPAWIRTRDHCLRYLVMLLCTNQFTQKLKMTGKGGQIIYTLIDADGGEEKSKESKHSDEDYSARSDEGSTESSYDSGYVKESPLIFRVTAIAPAT